jgi:hypothetical protein
MQEVAKITGAERVAVNRDLSPRVGMCAPALKSCVTLVSIF